MKALQPRSPDMSVLISDLSKMIEFPATISFHDATWKGSHGTRHGSPIARRANAIGNQSNHRARDINLRVGPSIRSGKFLLFRGRPSRSSTLVRSSGAIATILSPFLLPAARPRIHFWYVMSLSNTWRGRC